LRIDIYHHFLRSTPDPRMDEALDLLKQIITKENEIMATLDETLTVVQGEAAGIDSLIALVDGLKQQIADALSGVTLPPAVQQKIDDVFSAVTSNAQKVQGALDANGQPTTP
jgi:hypothetical protein